MTVEVEVANDEKDSGIAELSVAEAGDPRSQLQPEGFNNFMAIAFVGGVNVDNSKVQARALDKSGAGTGLKNSKGGVDGERA